MRVFKETKQCNKSEITGWKVGFYARCVENLVNGNKLSEIMQKLTLKDHLMDVSTVGNMS